MAEIVALSPELHALFGKSGAAEGSFGWFKALAETTLDDGEQAVVAVERDAAGTPRAALPLARKGRSLRALTAPYTTLFAPAFAEPDWARRLGEHAASFVGGVLRLDALDIGDPGVAAFLDGLGGSGLMTVRYHHFVNWYEAVGDFDSYWSRRPSRLRSTARRKLAQTPASFRCHRTPSELRQAMAAYEDIYRASWKEPEPHPRFMPEMVRALGEEGMVRLGLMLLEERPVAAQIWLVCGGRATIFKLAHREDAAEHSPGTLLSRWMAATVLREDAITEIDFGRGDDAYKRDWLNDKRPRFGVVAANWRHPAGLKAIVKDIAPTRLAALGRRLPR